MVAGWCAQSEIVQLPYALRGANKIMQACPFAYIAHILTTTHLLCYCGKLLSQTWLLPQVMIRAHPASKDLIGDASAYGSHMYA